MTDFCRPSLTELTDRPNGATHDRPKWSQQGCSFLTFRSPDFDCFFGGAFGCIGAAFTGIAGAHRPDDVDRRVFVDEAARQQVVDQGAIDGCRGIEVKLLRRLGALECGHAKAPCAPSGRSRGLWPEGRHLSPPA